MLRISNVSFGYRGEGILCGASVNFPEVGTVAVIGDNGSGKTTLLKLLTGELKPDDGAVRVDGEIGYLPQMNEDEALATKSGGEKTRLVLERIFARGYDVLLLDEPTNNLDAEAKAWLVENLLSFPGLAVVVSHDRELIDRVADYVLELEGGQLNLYPGNYTDYRARREQERIAQLRQYEKAERRRKEVAARMKRVENRRHVQFNQLRDENKMDFDMKRDAAQTGAGRTMKFLNHQLTKLEDVTKPQERKTYQARIEVDFLRRRRLLKATDLAKSYDGRRLFSEVNLEIYTGERWRITGRNGAGKTTLLKVILGDEQADVGEVKMAPSLRMGYIAQDVHGLNLEKNFLEQCEAPATAVFQAAIAMDLTKAELNRPCRELSRGQLTKLAFLKVIIEPVDLLILDEPTNHLDIRARENVDRALANYAGAILLVTHDENLATGLWVDKNCNLC